MITTSPNFPTTRLRRLRQHPQLRALIRETTLNITDCILPLFIHHGRNIRQPIESMPGHHQLSVDQLPKEIAILAKLKIPGVLLFGIPAYKDPHGSAAFAKDGIIQQAIENIKQQNPDLLVIADTCCCEYTNHGHCGIAKEKKGQALIDNDQTLEILAQQAISFAQAGADIIAPSAMMDGMVAAIRSNLDQEGFNQIPILSYAVKYASSFYGPFRDAAGGAPSFGDRRSHQMDPANGAKALREAELDIQEGADMLMVKPALAYLDIIHRIKQNYPAIPLCAYQVSGEYAMIKAAANAGWLDEQATAMESLLSIKRAGADFIITYFAKELALWLSQ